MENTVLAFVSPQPSSDGQWRTICRRKNSRFCAVVKTNQKFKTFANEHRYQNTNGTNIGTRVSFDKPYKTNKPKLLYQGYVECCTSMLEGNSNEISL